MYEYGALELDYLLVKWYAVRISDPINHKSKCTKEKAVERLTISKGRYDEQ